MLRKFFIGTGEVAGFTFEQQYMDNNWYIYKVSSYGTEWYEVFKRKKFYNSGQETYPKAKRFGETAWSIPTLEKAFAKITEKSHGGTTKSKRTKGISSRRSWPVPPKRRVRAASK